MKWLTFAGRNGKELLRDPLNLFFGLGFPLVLLFLLQAIQANIPVPLFEIGRLAPGITVFGLSFLTLFAALLVAKDRESAFLMRLYTTPLTATDFILGYLLPLLPLALLQSAVCYLAALPFGLPMNSRVVAAVIFNAPTALLFVALGVLCGSVLGVKQVGGLCGALLTNLSAWLSGVWFDLALVGGVFQRVAEALPFVHAVEWARAVLSGKTALALPHLYWVLGYALVITAAAVALFLRQMKRT